MSITIKNGVHNENDEIEQQVVVYPGALHTRVQEVDANLLDMNKQYTLYKRSMLELSAIYTLQNAIVCYPSDHPSMSILREATCQHLMTCSSVK